jgi:hypothetical protein
MSDVAITDYAREIQALQIQKKGGHVVLNPIMQEEIERLLDSPLTEILNKRGFQIINEGIVLFQEDVDLIIDGFQQLVSGE